MTVVLDTIGALAVAFVVAVMVATLPIWGTAWLLAWSIDRRWLRG